MAGANYQIQLRHIVVDKKEVAQLLKETIDSVNTETGRVKMLMRLAEKYSLCSSKEDGGNLGWLEIEWNANDIRQPRGGFKGLDNEELDQVIREAVQKETIYRGILFGPVQTRQGYHLLMISNQFKTDRIL
ncbi:MAG: hypothetical protein GWM98_01275 [Nitrospinaceae bacterium]|nr:hypothetical protein [Nitrospinaceae bacterium]NIR53379.1 hypothetical protein [Nitrospinaceae bacterium]NIS83783.1 hypothetical protein [Nitrospinaceae bacterium]NIT80582.1 hypothetical protein [Nitrospinaceae bacterium]NIU42903.1 hypothetical protein [Nitrospinaceae bacterium]